MQQNTTPRKFFLPPNAALTDPAVQRRLKMSIKNFDIGERDWKTAIQDAILEIDIRNGALFTSPEPVELPLIDDLIADERFVRRIFNGDPNEHLEELRWLSLVFIVRYPHLWRLITK